MTLQAAFVATLVDEWTRTGVTDAVIAPGSRSTPLALGLADSAIRVHVFLDERSAGFFALGLALSSGRPAPVVTTSGTAAAHLLPAVIEASLARVPMIVCSADRPPELHDVGAPQTIPQAGLYDGFVRWQWTFGAVADLPPSAWRSMAARSVISARTGPVHLNLAFRDPLLGAAEPDLIPPGRPGGQPWHAHVAATTTSASGVAGSLPSLPSLPSLSGRTGLIVAGSGIGSGTAVIIALARALGWPILAGPRSGCRADGAADPGVVTVAAFDAILRHPETAESLRPEVVLRFGGQMTSKVLNGWLEGVEQIVVGDWIDPERTASLFIDADPASVAASFLSLGPAPAPDGWMARWRAAETRAQEAISSVLAGHASVTEPGVARAVTGCLGRDATLVVASSMPIRDVEWYGDPGSGCRVLANRGANGIDGLVSTALGVAAGSDGPCVALLGDLAFLHDSGGLLGAGRRGLDCTFVVVDNDGGGIFSFLPQGSLPTERFEQLFGTPHGIDLADLAAVHGIPTVVVKSGAEVAPAVRDAVEAGGVRLILARTDRAENVKVHEQLTAAVAAALEAE